MPLDFVGHVSEVLAEAAGLQSIIVALRCFIIDYYLTLLTIPQISGFEFAKYYMVLRFVFNSYPMVTLAMESINVVVVVVVVQCQLGEEERGAHFRHS